MKTLLLTYVLFSGADAGTTHYALNHGGREVMWPTQNPWVVDSLTGVQAVGVGKMLNRLHSKHPKLAITLAVISVGVRGTVVASNINQLRHHAN